MELILMFANDIALIEHPDTQRTSRKIQIWQKLAGNSPKLNLTKIRRCSVSLWKEWTNFNPPALMVSGPVIDLETDACCL